MLHLKRSLISGVYNLVNINIQILNTISATAQRTDNNKNDTILVRDDMLFIYLLLFIIVRLFIFAI